jgi:hypothetical protein
MCAGLFIDVSQPPPSTHSSPFTPQPLPNLRPPTFLGRN